MTLPRCHYGTVGCPSTSDRPHECPRPMPVFGGNKSTPPTTTEERAVSQPAPATPDMVNRPPHYTTGTIEVLDFIRDQQFGYLEGNVVKYLSRARHKGTERQDLEKARFYLDRRIGELREAEAA